MRVAYLHGLEAPHKTIKNEYLSETFEFVYDPPMNYKDPDLFNTVLQGVQEHKIDLIIGSSMGGYFAHRLSTLTGIPVLLFNPAVVGRSYQPIVPKIGELHADHTIVIGKHDDVILPSLSLDYFEEWGADPAHVHIEDIGHRTPLEIFKKYVNNFVK